MSSNSTTSEVGGGHRHRKKSRKVGPNSPRIIKMGREINLRQARKIAGYQQPKTLYTYLNDCNLRNKENQEEKQQSCL